MSSSDLSQEILNSSPFGICIVQNGFIRFANNAILQWTGYTLTEISNLPLRKLLHHSDYFRIIKNEIQHVKGQPVPVYAQFKVVNRLHQIIEVTGLFTPVNYNGEQSILVQIFDSALLNPLKDLLLKDEKDKFDQVINVLRTSETRYKEVTNSLPEVVFEMDIHFNITFVNKRAFDLFEITEAEYEKGINLLNLVAPFDRDRAKQNIKKMLQEEEVGAPEYFLQKKDGDKFPVIIHANPVFQDKKPVGLRGIIIDITERKQIEEQLKHLSQYDALTGLYNRAFFENEMRKLQQINKSLGIIIIDVDGLKFINDTMGHSYGDLLIAGTAKIIKETFRKNDILARIGGDEFAVLLNNTTETEVKNLSQRLHSAIIWHNETHFDLPLSVSCGYAVSSDGMSNPNSLFREADNNMYREKLYHRKSNRSAIVQTLMKALEARDFITEGHADRLHDLVVKVAGYINLSENRKRDLRLLAQFHDIGKVGIPDRILFKEGPLTKEEMAEMQRHSEIGYRIAQSAPDLNPIADWILKHHEWWNGNGYPLGLCNEEIPLECRILAIADAYDAMTNDRPYRKAISHKDAVIELKKFAGIQFDPELVNKFIKIIKFKEISYISTDY